MEIIGLIVLSLLCDLIWGGVSYVAGRALLELAQPWRKKHGALQSVRPMGSEEHVAPVQGNVEPADSNAMRREESQYQEQEAGDPFSVALLGTIFLLVLLGGNMADGQVALMCAGLGLPVMPGGV